MPDCTPPSANRFVLHPGDVVLAERGDTIETLLGSCITLLLVDPRRTVCAACHVVHTVAHQGSSDCSTAGGAAALDCMIDGLRSRGLNASMCDAFVYGGGDMFPTGSSRRTIGETNGEWFLSRLRSMGVRLAEVDVGGASYRKLKWTVGPTTPEIQHTPL